MDTGKMRIKGITGRRQAMINKKIINRI